ncbi:hypothetical protein BDQ17DRAFT_1357350 [Cyathus striatus]|nr:hypothetical protein BDQ17DRAFT_1357350 [Cyathus striatus]
MSVLKDFDAQKLSNILSTKYYYVAASTLLLYDYILSFPQEITFVWQKRKTPATILFFLNRYISMAFCIIVLTSYFLPGWTESMYSISDEYPPLADILTNYSAVLDLPSWSSYRP